MATGIVHKYAAELEGVTAAEGDPVAVVYDNTNPNTLIAFNNMHGDRLQSLRVRRTDDTTASTYNVHIYADEAGTQQVYSVYAVDVSTDYKWDFSMDDLNTDARPAVNKLYVTAVVTAGADPIDLLVELTVAPVMAGV